MESKKKNTHKKATAQTQQNTDSICDIVASTLAKLYENENSSVLKL